MYTWTIETNDDGNYLSCPIRWHDAEVVATYHGGYLTIHFQNGAITAYYPLGDGLSEKSLSHFLDEEGFTPRQT